MKTFLKKALPIAISTVMAFTALAVYADDNEIYKKSENGKVTLMFQIDLSGSMDFTSVYADYEARRVEKTHPMRLEITAGATNPYNRYVVTSQHQNAYSYDQNNTKYLYDTSPNGVTRKYFPVPDNAENKMWINNKVKNGCPKVGSEYRCYTRISRLQDAFVRVLSEKDADGNYSLKDDVIIGLSGFSNAGDNQTGYIINAARPLGEKVGSQTQRELLIEKFKNLSATGGTPTGNGFAETMAYMFGTSVNDGIEREYFAGGAGPYQFVCTSFSGATCSNFQNFPFPRGVSLSNYTDTGKWFQWGNLRPRAHKGQFNGGLPFADPTAVSGNKYIKPQSLADQLTNPQTQQCSGQGIYVLTDGEPNSNFFTPVMMKAAFDDKSFSCANSNEKGWDCMHDATKALLDPSKNPTGLVLKTAVVGFGTGFNSVPSYDGSLTEKQNLDAVDASSGSDDVKNAARWGIIGQGGWYSGNSPEDIIESINNFIAKLQTEIPTTVTGQPFIPIDPLNPLTYMNDGYYGAFTPLPEQKRLFWKGDINKYHVKNQGLYGKDTTTPLFTGTGVMSATTVGFWSDGTPSKNGLTAMLDLQSAGRPVFTNHTSSSNANLTKVTVNELFDATGTMTSDTTHRNAWLNVLGYGISDLDKPVATKSALTGLPEMRQLGAIMHSTPIILTQSGKVLRGTGGLDTTQNRQDYVLFGSTQGILHVVDGATGKEKIAFVPKDVMTNQRDNFQASENATSSLGKLTYGIDGQWTAYTQYVTDASGTGLTVNNGTAPTSASDLNGKGVQWVYGGQRMGGKSYYGLDLTDMDNPKIKFHIDPASAPSGSPLSYMGQSWSKPVLGFVNWKGKRTLVMFVGGGYDNDYEDRVYNQTSGEGGGVYMFDAHNGELLWWGSSHATDSVTTTQESTKNDHLKYSVPSQIATLDLNGDGLIDNLFFGDLGGQIFRVDMDNESTNGLVSRIVRVYNGHQTGGLSPRFYETPSFSVHSGAGATGQFGVISIASGNRSSPLARGAESASDALFVIYDHDILSAGMHKKPAVGSPDAFAKDEPTDRLVTMTADIMGSNDNTKEVKATAGSQGWKYYLSSGENGRLKGFSTPRVVDNLLFLNTYTPDGGTTTTNSCNAGVIGDSYLDVFCMPSGVCTAEQLSVLGTHDDKVAHPDGSLFRAFVSIGNVQTAVGNATGNTVSSINGPVSPIDCTQAPHKDSVLCIKEVSGISNKPTRWYENSSK